MRMSVALDEAVEGKFSKPGRQTGSGMTLDELFRNLDAGWGGTWSPTNSTSGAVGSTNAPARDGSVRE